MSVAHTDQILAAIQARDQEQFDWAFDQLRRQIGELGWTDAALPDFGTYRTGRYKNKQRAFIPCYAHRCVIRTVHEGSIYYEFIQYSEVGSLSWVEPLFRSRWLIHRGPMLQWIDIWVEPAGIETDFLLKVTQGDGTVWHCNLLREVSQRLDIEPIHTGLRERWKRELMGGGR